MFVQGGKQCGKCRQTLPLDGFNRLGDGRQHWCRECFRKYFRARGALHLQQVREAKRRHRRAAKAYVLDYLSSRLCADCGEPDVVVLEFDHVGAKEADVAVLVAEGQSIARIEREVAQCEVVCANCHRRRTAERRPRRPLATRVQRAKVRNQAFIRRLLASSACADCGHRDPRVLEFDHVGRKRHNISDLVHGGYRLELVQEELAECEVCCANCHRRRTARRTVNYRWRSTMIPPP
jgi:5-methylcytosine-specific restriction endonuclease McrA